MARGAGYGDEMKALSRYVAERVERPAAEVYAFAVEPANLTAWAPGLCTAVEQVDGQWYVETPGGRAAVTFAPDNPFGILDHEVTFSSGETFYNPMRVVPDGDGSEVAFTVRRWPGMTEEEHERDAGLVAADLARLREIVEKSAG